MENALAFVGASRMGMTTGKKFMMLAQEEPLLAVSRSSGYEHPVLTNSARTALAICFKVIEEDSPAARKAACKAALRI